jgi:hypothetical protein
MYLKDASFPTHMNKQQHKTLHHVTAAIFALIAILHALRLFYQWPAMIAGWTVPLWLSVVAVLVAGILSVLLWKSAK